MKNNIFRMTFLVLTFSSCINTNTNFEESNDSKKDLSKASFSEFSEPKFKKGFKAFLKEKKIDMNIDVPNEYETIQPKNKYSNHYFKVTTDFPDNWEHDRGVSEYGIFRTFNIDSSITLALIAVPLEIENSHTDESHKAFQESPLKATNEMVGGDYKSYMLKKLTSGSGIKIYDFELAEKKFGSTNYLKCSYKHNEVIQDTEIPFITINYSTTLWGISYAIGYTVPLPFYDSTILETVLNRTTFSNPYY